jgi:CcmD family protein
MKKAHIGVAGLAILLFALIVPGRAAAQAQPQSQPQQPPAAQSEYVPADQLPAAQQEQMPAAPLVIVAYAIVWLALLLYLWSIWRRLQKVDRELADVAAQIAAKQARR